jgi:hypothetical protein
MAKRRTKNQMLCARIPQNLKLERSKGWGTNGTFLYCIEITNEYYKYPNRAIIGTFETEKERDFWFSHWEKVLTNYKNELKS